MFNTNIGIFVFDKNKKSLEGYKTIRNSKLQISNNSFFSIGNTSEMVGAIFRPDVLCNLKQNNSKIFELLKNLKCDDNPILILYKFK